jgi:three-Cys-motif partner protein
MGLGHWHNPMERTMSKAFHEHGFDDSTQVKLAVFRGYVREWISVFLTGWSTGKNFKSINIFDLFSGPGSDALGNPGSPRIIQDELKSFCEARGGIKADGLSIRLYFNDKDGAHIEKLRHSLEENACGKGCCKTVYSSKSFQDAFDECLPIMQDRESANLVIMDQFGVKEVTPAVVKTLAACDTTDILFFISSSYIRRFADVPAIQSYFQMSADDLAASDYKSIHRHICGYFRSTLPNNVKYHLAPFSIRKGRNIYGVIFGSGSLLGLKKFLEVCWKLDGVTGEANYDIDDDPARFGQLSLFAEMNVIRKQDDFERDLEQMLREKANAGTDVSPANNLDVFCFTLERGFLPKHANVHLAALQRNGRLEVTAPITREAVRKGAFYLTWDNFRKSHAQAVFRLKD